MYGAKFSQLQTITLSPTSLPRSFRELNSSSNFLSNIKDCIVHVDMSTITISVKNFSANLFL